MALYILPEEESKTFEMCAWKERQKEVTLMSDLLKSRQSDTQRGDILYLHPSAPCDQ